MGDIAETVDLTKGGLYYIKGKKALLYAIMNFALDLLEEKVMGAARAEDDPEKRLAALLGGYVQLVLDEPDSMAILVSEGHPGQRGGAAGYVLSPADRRAQTDLRRVPARLRRRCAGDPEPCLRGRRFGGRL